MFSRSRARFGASCLSALLVAGQALAALHIVNVSGMQFQPGNRVVQEGDTVRWVLVEGVHTVTNGTGASDRNAGNLFDANLGPGSTSFEHVFQTAGNYPYFCRVHVTMGMTGTITVEMPVGADRSSFGRIKALYDSL